MKYKVIWDKDKKIFESEVNEYLALGWQLQGGIYKDRDGYYQAATILKEDDYD